MPVVKSKKTVIVVLIGCALILTVFLAWKIISQTGLGLDSLFQPESSYGYPKLEFRLDDSRLAVKPGDNQALAAKILFEQLGFRPNWDEIYLPNLNKQNLSLQPHTITFTIKHISQHSPVTHDPLFASTSRDGRRVSGFTCSEGSDLEALDCNLFLNEAFFKEADLQKAQSYAANYTVSALLMLTKHELSPYGAEYGQFLTKYHQQLKEQNAELIKVVQKQGADINLLKTIQNLFPVLQFPQTYAQECTGHLKCYQWDYDCQCDDGTSCWYNQDDCPEGICTDCDQTCGSTAELDPNWCDLHAGERCQSPYSGTCEAISDIYCRTEGICYWSDGTEDPTTPAPLPPPPEDSNCPACCLNQPGYCNNDLPEYHDECPDGYICCESCKTPDGQWPTRGKYRGWIFHDVNKNNQFDSEDNRVPTNILGNTNIHVATTANRQYNHSALQDPEDSIWRNVYEKQCTRCDQINPDNQWDCISCVDSNHVQNASLCTCRYWNICFFRTCNATCGGQTICQNETNMFQNSPLFPTYYDSSKFDTFSYEFIISSNSDVTSKITTTWEVQPPPGWEVSLIRFAEPHTKDGNSNWHEVQNQSTITGNLKCWGCGSTKFEQRTRLLVIGISPIEPINNPPTVESTKIDQINDESDHDYEICSALNADNSMVIQSLFRDWDGPFYTVYGDTTNHVMNGGFELLDANNNPYYWNLSARDGNTQGQADIVNDSDTGQRALRITNTGSGYYRASQLVNLNPNSRYNLTVAYKNDEGSNGMLKAHTYCASTYIGSASHNFSQHHNNFYTDNFSFSTPSCSDSLDITVHADANQGGDITIDSIFLREIPTGTTEAEPFSDIRTFQVNLENQEGGTYNSSYWPVRLLLNRVTRPDPSTPPTTYEIINGLNNQSVRRNVKYSFMHNRWYLDQDISTNIATLVASDLSDPINPTWNTYFELADIPSHPNYKNLDILAQWKIRLNQNFPIGDFFTTSHIYDFSEAQDERMINESYRQTMVLNGSDYYFHRFDEVASFNPYIDFRFFEDPQQQASVIGGLCSGPNTQSAILTGSNSIEVEDVTDPANIITDTNQPITGEDYQMQLSSCGEKYDITLSLQSSDPAESYVCTCGMDLNDAFTCRYYDVDPSYLNNDQPIDFYLTKINLSNNPWFQTIGGSIYSAGDIQSYIPNDGSNVYSVSNPCVTAEGCQPALIAASPFAGGANNSPGFPLTQSNNWLAIDTHKNPNPQLDNIHFDSNRTQAVDANARSLVNSLRIQDYQYHYNLFGFEYDDAGNHLSGPSFPGSLNSSQLNVRFYASDLTINETNNWMSMPNDTQLVVFVDGDLTFTHTGNPSNTRQINQVPEGSFLSFIVSGNIVIEESVGYEAPEAGTPLDPDTEIVAFATPDSFAPNLEGVFIADGTITIQGPLGGPADGRDNKFIGAGSFIGWGGINLERNFDDGAGGIGKALNNLNPTETFIHRPDFVMNMPDEMMESLIEWSEALPEKP